MPKVYVGTYYKYNMGNLCGAWLDLEHYTSEKGFYDACALLHSDESDPEFMFQDNEGVPSIFITEYSIDAGIWSYMRCHFDDYVKMAYIGTCGVWDAEECESNYIGNFYSDDDLGRHVADMMGTIDEIPEYLRMYFDYESYGRDARLDGGIVGYNGHYFWSN